MKINTSSWHYKIYAFNSKWVARWMCAWNWYEKPGPSAMIGLCPYMRMILLWGPIVMLTNIVPLGAVVYAILLFPVDVNGAGGVGWIVGIAALGLVGVFLSRQAGKWISKKAQESVEKQSRKKSEEKDGTGFFTIMAEYVKTFKSKVCPIMEVDNDS